MRTARTLAATLIVALASLSIGAAAGSAKKAPAGFYGVVPQTNLSANDYDRMGTGKVGTLRTILNWGFIDQSASTGDENWSQMDAIVLNAAKNGIEVLPFIYGTPEYVAKQLDNNSCSASSCGLYAPKSQAALDAWQSFVGNAVKRYGPGGTLWSEHPEVPKVPITAWQIWNEQNSKSFYAPKPNPKSYAKLLASANTAIKQQDPSADVVLGGMAELAGSHKAIRGSKYLAKLYKVRGVKKTFDAVAPHPYGATVAKVSSQVDLYRAAMKKAHDSRAEMYVTEIGAGSAKGGNALNRGTKGQARLLTDVYKYFGKVRKKYKIQSVDWFSWMDSSESICSWCSTSGLLKASGAAKPSYKAFTKLTGGRPSKHKH